MAICTVCLASKAIVRWATYYCHKRLFQVPLRVSLPLLQHRLSLFPNVASLPLLHSVDAVTFLFLYSSLLWTLLVVLQCVPVHNLLYLSSKLSLSTLPPPQKFYMCFSWNSFILEIKNHFFVVKTGGSNFKQALVQRKLTSKWYEGA